MSADECCMWNSIEVYHEYTDAGGTLLTHRQVIHQVKDHFHGDLLVLTSPGYASVIAFHQGAAGTLRVVKDDKSDDINAICQVANQIVTECKNVENDKTSYIFTS